MATVDIVVEDLRRALAVVGKSVAWGEGEDDNPRIPYPHYETSILVASGASGGPVFDERGRVVGINCCSFGFGEDPGPEGEHSYVIPTACLLAVRLQQGTLQFNPRSRSYATFGGDPHRPKDGAFPSSPSSATSSSSRLSLRTRT